MSAQNNPEIDSAYLTDLYDKLLQAEKKAHKKTQTSLILIGMSVVLFLAVTDLFGPVNMPDRLLMNHFQDELSERNDPLYRALRNEVLKAGDPVLLKRVDSLTNLIHVNTKNTVDEFAGIRPFENGK